ncbi:hypothetical protein F0M18_06055 [Pseudohalioglobus sediminis]|uniref:Uncharacterized protein n=1 Tax=Pseudohalioglobus sediminis TaxID=2606449 RepID=A0A5B0X4B2_9GAMM|nr:hypothetical protein [Pseudohalioglobus sediminis]KAA1193397.1 hypothetical protein F0M18_06055 [Pseudohalioglobus sediminis]
MNTDGLRLLGALLGSLLWAGCFPVLAAARSLPATPDDFCAFAQSVIAETALVPRVDIYDDREAFIQSKPTDDPFLVTQMAALPVSAQLPLATVISCKMRTAERINAIHGAEDGSGSAPAGTESSCDAVHRRVLDEVMAGVPSVQRRLSPADWVVEEEQLTFIGPRWIDPWPFQPVTRDGAGRLHLHTRALYVPYAWWIPMPGRFLGNYYCHLANPAYIEALTRGQVPLDSLPAQP